MARLIALTLLAVALVAPGVVAAGPTIDLRQPGALAALRHANPAHYAKVTRILEGVTRRPDADVPRWLRVGFDARDVDYAPIVLTSHPAQRRLSFALDDTRYVAVVVLTHLRGDVVPLK
jgi:hypothetical protein